MREPKEIKKTIPTLAFVVDGETEIWYLQMFKQWEEKNRNLRINIEPKIPQRKTLQGQYDLVRKQAKSEFDKVFWIVDLDVILKETRDSPNRRKTTLAKFLEYRNWLYRDFQNVCVVVNNPCMEYWFLLHYIYSQKLYRNCKEVIDQLKKHLKDYEKSERYFKKKNQDIYTLLRPSLLTAINHANRLGGFDDQNPECSLTEMDFVFLCNELKQYFQE